MIDFSLSLDSETDAVNGSCNLTFVTPACLQSLYGIPSTPVKNTENQLVVTGYELEWPQEADLTVGSIYAVSRGVLIWP